MPGFRWTPGIGDPSFIGWLTVAAYFITGWMCLRAFMAEKSGPPRPYFASISALVRVLQKHWPNPPLPARRAAIWLGLATLLLALGINKQLDLQTLFTDVARSIFRALGLYGERRSAQLLFVGLILLAACVAAVQLLRLARGQLRDFRLSLLGATIVCAFVAMRAASFHHIDHVLGSAASAHWLNGFFELSGIALIFVAAATRLRNARGK